MIPCRSPVVDSAVSNDEAWQHGRLLQVGNDSYIVHRNPPTVEKVPRAACVPFSNQKQVCRVGFSL